MTHEDIAHVIALIQHPDTLAAQLTEYAVMFTALNALLSASAAACDKFGDLMQAMQEKTASQLDNKLAVAAHKTAGWLKAAAGATAKLINWIAVNRPAKPPESPKQ